MIRFFKYIFYLFLGLLLTYLLMLDPDDEFFKPVGQLLYKKQTAVIERHQRREQKDSLHRLDLEKMRPSFTQENPSKSEPSN